MEATERLDWDGMGSEMSFPSGEEEAQSWGIWLVQGYQLLRSSDGWRASKHIFP